MGKINHKRLSPGIRDSLRNYKIFISYEITGRITHITLLLPLLTRYDVKAPVFTPLKSMFPSPSI
jgi:hypothetical protein